MTIVAISYFSPLSLFGFPVYIVPVYRCKIQKIKRTIVFFFCLSINYKDILELNNSTFDIQNCKWQHFFLTVKNISRKGCMKKVEIEINETTTFVKCKNCFVLSVDNDHLWVFFFISEMTRFYFQEMNSVLWNWTPLNPFTSFVKCRCRFLTWNQWIRLILLENKEMWRKR